MLHQAVQCLSEECGVVERSGGMKRYRDVLSFNGGGKGG